MVEFEKVLNEIYFDPSRPGGFGGATKLFIEARKKIPDLTVEKVKKWLKGQPTYTIFKPKRNRFKRLKILVNDIDEQWQADLMDMNWFSRFNQGVKYLLVVIDIFSKYAWAVPLKAKSAEAVVNGMKSVLEQGRKPSKLQTDQGKEFVNSSFKALMKKHNINFFTTTDDTVKCAVVERVNRTLRERIYRYLYHKSSNKYINVLNNILRSYNHSYHRSIGMPPVEVTAETRDIVLSKFQEHPGAPQKAYKVGQYVRISRSKEIFEKGAEQNWSEEVFRIKQAKRTPAGPVYKLVDLYEEPITSIFYHKEVQPVAKPETYRIEKILKYRTNPSTKKSKDL